MIKLIAIDMDGTLLNSQKQLAQEEIDAIHYAISRGVEVVLCTGRCLNGVLPYYNQLKLTHNSYAILNNGCSIHQTSDWGLIDWVQLTKKDMLYLESLRQENPNVELTLFDETHFFCVEKDPSPLVIEDSKLVFTTPEKIAITEATSGKYTMFEAMILAKPHHLDEFVHQYNNKLAKDYSVVRSQDYIYEVMPYGTTKASGLEKLAKRLNISKENIMTIGDGNNDIEMLQYAGLGIAMANASDTVKQYANAITDTNDNHGVAKAIYKYIK